MPIDILPDNAVSWAKSQEAMGRIVVQRSALAKPGANCPECNDLQSVWIQSITKHAVMPPHFNQVVVNFENNIHLVLGEEQFPCLACAVNDTVRVATLLNRSGLEPTEQDWTIHKLRGLEKKDGAYQAACELLSETPHPHNVWLFHGQVGRGKSGLLKSLVAMFCKARVTALYTTAEDILVKLRSTFGNNSHESEEQILALYGGYQVLAIDELGVTSSTDWATAALRTLINKRYDKRFQSCTILATNRQPTDLQEYLYSRLETGNMIEIGGVDLRSGEVYTWTSRKDIE